MQAGASSAAHQCWKPMLLRACLKSMSEGIGREAFSPAAPAPGDPVSSLERAGFRSCSSMVGTTATATSALAATPVIATVQVKRLSSFDLRMGISSTS